MDSERHSRYSGILFVVLTLLGWSSVLLFLKHLAPHIDVWTANGWRYGVSALMWLPLLVAGFWRQALPDGLWRRAIVPTLFNCGGQVCFGASIYYIDPGLAGFLLRVALISSTLGAFVLFADERVLMRRGAFWLGMGLVAAGSVGTIVFGHQPIIGGTAVGIALGAGSGIFFGLYGVSVRYWMRGVPSMTSFAAISLYTAAVMVALMIWRADGRGASVFALSASNWFVLIASALIGIALGHVFYYASIARLGVAVASAVVQLAPFIGGAASVVIFKEILTPMQWISGVVMLGGAGVLLWSEQSRRAAASTVRRESSNIVKPARAGDDSGRAPALADRSR
jgi:drug/metabolite transporter (DMT)-like permease